MYALVVPEIVADNLMKLDTTNFYYKFPKPFSKSQQNNSVNLNKKCFNAISIVSAPIKLATFFWPIYDRVNTIMQRMVQQGLISQFERNMKSILGMRDVREPKPLLDISYVTFNDLKYLFILFLVLIVICIAVFLGEEVYGNASKIRSFFSTAFIKFKLLIAVVRSKCALK